MKNFYVITTCLSLLLTCLILPDVHGQSLVVGTVKKGQPIVTSLANATTALSGGLTTGASISEVNIAQNPETGQYYLLGIVQNGNISAKAVELENDGILLRAIAGGPGLEVTCTGINCSTCIPVIKQWKPKCECQDNPVRQNAECNMTSKVILTIW